MLKVDRLTVAYDSGGVVVRDMSLSVARGQVVSVAGLNGAGKTTLLCAASGLLPAGGRVIGGAVKLGRNDLTGRPSWVRVRHGMAHVMEGRRVFASLTVTENLRIGAHTRSRKHAAASVEEWLARTPELAARRETAAGVLSGGEQQLLAIGRALGSAPAYLLLDEPALGLAPQAVERVIQVIDEVRQSGVGVLVAEQNLAVASALSADVHVLDRGHVVLLGTAQQLGADPLLAAAYLGAPR